MAGHIKFGDNLDKLAFCVVYKIPKLLLCVKTAVRSVVSVGLLSKSRNFGKTRIFFNFNPPPLVVSQVKVKDVNFEKGENINDFIKVFNGVIVAHHVKHIGAVGIAWIIAYVKAGQKYFIFQVV